MRPVIWDTDRVRETLLAPLNDRQTKTLAPWGDWLIELSPMLYNYRLVMTPIDDLNTWSYGWCYASPIAATLGMLAWDPDTQDEPAGWIKRPTACIRRAPHREDGAAVRCAHGHWPLSGDCEWVGCEAWRAAAS